MPDTYSSKPDAEMILHDLTRIYEESGSGIILAPGSTLTGPRERIESAVIDYRNSPDWDANLETPDLLSHYMAVEHGMWQAVVGLLREKGIEINDEDELTATLEVWGERLAKLRLNQTREVREQAEFERIERFEALRKRRQLIAEKGKEILTTQLKKIKAEREENADG